MKNECAEYVLRRQDGNHAVYSVRPAVRIDALTEKPPAMSLPESYKSGMSLRTRLGCTAASISGTAPSCEWATMFGFVADSSTEYQGRLSFSVRVVLMIPVPDAKAVAAMMKYNGSLLKAGRCLLLMVSTRLRWARASRFSEGSPW